MIITGLRYNQSIWEGILKDTYYCLGLVILYCFTNSTLIELKKQEELTSEFLSKLRDPKIFEKSFNAITKKFKRYFTNKNKGILHSVISLLSPQSKYSASPSF
jgi:hypothetical protein